ncbi:MAG: outer membrane protein assembly factor BamE [Verrucomicrobiota bacterium]|nr:outer membrane protein assembly factor BamE [Verrucomicrobiota bacterium]
MNNILHPIKKVLFVSAFLLVAACGSKLTSNNLDKIKEGSTAADVKMLLGKPTKENSTSLIGVSTTTYQYEEGTKKVSITFVNEKVVSISKDL